MSWASIDVPNLRKGERAFRRDDGTTVAVGAVRGQRGEDYISFSVCGRLIDDQGATVDGVETPARSVTMYLAKLADRGDDVKAAVRKEIRDEGKKELARILRVKAALEAWSEVP